MVEASESLDDLFQALSDERRRQVLFALLDHDGRGAVSVPDGGSTGGEPGSRRVEMHHVHLPKLVDMGLVEWDRDASRVGTGPNFEDVRPVLESLRDDTPVDPNSA